MSVRPGLPRTADAGDLSSVAADVKGLLDDGRRDAAAERFGDIVRQWQGRANRLAYYYLGNAADADDAVQDAFVKVYGHMTTFRPELSFDAWFTRILVNTCLDRLRARRAAGSWVDLEGAGPLESREPSAERALISASAWRSVADAVRALPPRQREAFILCHVQQASPKEAAAALGMNHATFRVHLFRALRKLRGVLGAR
jgi:RNA polymerase sigma-70 factor, ECF subfamily